MGIASDIKTLGEGIVASYDSRVKAIGTLVKDTHQMLKGFNAEHKEMSEKLRTDLAKGEEDRIKDFNPMMTGIQKEIKEIETYVKNKLEEFSEAHADMSKELKKELANYVDDLVKATKKLMGDIQTRQKERNAEVADLLEVYKTERERMSANWQNLVATIAKRRGVEPVEFEAREEVKTVEEAVEETEKKGKKKSGKKGKGKKR